MNINTQNIKTLFDKLKFEELYLVGGAVRDLILELPIKDFDFCCPYTPKQIKQKLKESGIEKTFDVGEKFGTIGCIVEGLDVEITCYRGESYNYLNRKPEVVYIDSIEEDVKRRDFTINSLYLGRDDLRFFTDKHNGSYGDSWCIDKHRTAGTSNLMEGVIKTVGDPAKRFKEDPLRMLRAVRFAIKYNFTIAEKTFDMIKRLRVELLKVSAERWTMEMDKILSIEKPDLKILGKSDLLNIMIPELSYQIGFDQNSRYHDLTLWEHTMEVVQATPFDDLNLRWAALLHDLGKPFVKTENKKGHYNYMGHEVMSAYLVKQIGQRLKWTGERTKAVSELAEHHLRDYCKLREYDNVGKKGD